MVQDDILGIRTLKRDYVERSTTKTQKHGKDDEERLRDTVLLCAQDSRRKIIASCVSSSSCSIPQGRYSIDAIRFNFTYSKFSTLLVYKPDLLRSAYVHF